MPVVLMRVKCTPYLSSYGLFCVFCRFQSIFLLLSALTPSKCI
jgi:hypothetical protein